MEPLSKPLMDWLLKLDLCTRADLRRCRGRVRQLARDVPAFDSLWIDALVQARKLTAFQAKLLESGQPERLAVGPCVLVDRLGHGTSATYLARHPQHKERCVLKLITIPEEHRNSTLESLRHLVSLGEKLAHPSAIIPQFSLVHQHLLVTISRYVAGPPLNQLLVRRGRFPARIVLALARQLVDGLAALEECGVVHGDLRLQNLRLAASGRVMLVDAGIAPVIRPELTFQARISPERYDGVAPELIGTGNRVDSRSEFYALGCLLWQLLAGRPPFPTGDPLAKLMAHQTRRIPDVRDIAPDTPAELADILRAFTEPDPFRRPSSFRAFHSRWRDPKRADRRQIARFRSAFNTAIPHVPAMTPEAPSSRWPVIAAMLFLFSGVTLSLMDSGTYSQLLAIPGRFQELVHDRETSAASANSAEDASTGADKTPGIPLPLPNADGVIELTEAGPYRASQIDTVGPLTIRGTAGVPSEIVIADAPCRFTAADVLVENILFRRAKPSKASQPLLQVASSSFVLRKCGFRLSEEPSNSSPKNAGVEWKPINPANLANGRVGFENCVFFGRGHACRCLNWPRQIVVKNCLKTDAGVLLDFAPTEHPLSSLQLTASQLTLRGASGLLRCELGSKNLSTSWLVRADNCAWDLHAEAAGVFQVSGASAGRFYRQLQLQGRNCLLNDAAAVAAWGNPLAKKYQAVDASALHIEGLVLAKLTFAGSKSDHSADAKLITWQGPRFSSVVPGIDPARLPVWSE